MPFKQLEHSITVILIFNGLLNWCRIMMQIISEFLLQMTNTINSIAMKKTKNKLIQSRLQCKTSECSSLGNNKQEIQQNSLILQQKKDLLHFVQISFILLVIFNLFPLMLSIVIRLLLSLMSLFCCKD